MAMGTIDAATTLNDRLRRVIKTRMTWLDLTGKALAKELGVSPAWVSYRLTGEVVIDVLDLDRIAGALGIEPEDLIAQARRGSMSTKTSLTKRIGPGAVRTIVPSADQALTGRVPPTGGRSARRLSRLPS